MPHDPVTKESRTATWLNAKKWFVEFESEPTASGGNRINIQRQQRSFIDEARDAGRPAQVNKTYERLFNGVSVDADAATAEVYAELPGVKSVYPVRIVSVPESQEVTPRLLTAIAHWPGQFIVEGALLRRSGVLVCCKTDRHTGAACFTIPDRRARRHFGAVAYAHLPLLLVNLRVQSGHNFGDMAIDAG